MSSSSFVLHAKNMNASEAMEIVNGTRSANDTLGMDELVRVTKMISEDFPELVLNVNETSCTLIGSLYVSITPTHVRVENQSSDPHLADDLVRAFCAELGWDHLDPSASRVRKFDGRVGRFAL